jgi:hypothetical protein
VLRTLDLYPSGVIEGSRQQVNLSILSKAFLPVRARAVVIRWIDFKCLEVYEAGAMLVTLLACPVESEETRSRVHASLCTRAIRAKCLIEPDWATSAQSIKPIYALRAQPDINRDLLTLERRLRDRAVAGRMVIAFLKETLTGEIPPAINRLSLNELAKFVLDDTGFTNADNVETRIWRPSLPVIHLASAVQVLLFIAEPEVGPIGLEALLLSREVIELVIRTAEYHETVIAQSRRLRVDPERLIRIRLA